MGEKELSGYFAKYFVCDIILWIYNTTLSMLVIAQRPFITWEYVPSLLWYTGVVYTVSTTAILFQNESWMPFFVKNSVKTLRRMAFLMHILSSADSKWFILTHYSSVCVKTSFSTGVK